MASPQVDVFAWAFGCTSQEVLQMLKKWKGKLGVVLYRKAFDAALADGSFIAHCTSIADAKAVAALVAQGARFVAATYLDEWNFKMTWAEYEFQATAIKAVLSGAGVPFWGMTTRGSSYTNAPDFSWLNEETMILKTPVVCWNSSGTRESILEDIGLIHVPVLLSPHPWRFTIWPLFNSGWLNWIKDRLAGRTAYWYARDVAAMPSVRAVAFWSLRAYGPGHFGLHTRRGNLTALGRAVSRALQERG